MDKSHIGGDEHTLNALVDGELDSAARREILRRLREEEELRGIACSLRHVKTLVHHGYASAEPPRRRREHPMRRAMRFPSMAAAAVLLGIGFAAGLLIPDGIERHEPEAYVAHSQGAEPAAVVNGVRIEPRQVQPNKFVLHISQGGEHRFADVMDRVEKLLAVYPGPGLEIEVVANSEGLGLFREETSTQVDRIRLLTERHENIHFIACQNTMEVLQRQGVRTRLVTGTKTTQSAVDHIIDRLQDGWVYVRT